MHQTPPGSIHPASVPLDDWSTVIFLLLQCLGDFCVEQVRESRCGPTSRRMSSNLWPANNTITTQTPACAQKGGNNMRFFDVSRINAQGLDLWDIINGTSLKYKRPLCKASVDQKKPDSSPRSKSK